MALDVDAVRKIARLARIRVPDADLPQLAGELSGILTWIEQLNEVNTAEVEPMTGVVGQLKLPMREDSVTDGGIAAQVLANAPGGAVLLQPGAADAGGFYTVPKVVE